MDEILPKSMKGELELKILDAINTGVSIVEDMMVIFSAPYGSSFGSIQKRIDEHHGVRPKFSKHAKIDRSTRRSFARMKCKLLKGGLIKKSKSSGYILRLTNKGAEKLNELKFRFWTTVSCKHLSKDRNEELKIIIFDIPEKYRRKRLWLREVLKSLGFKMLQKSVWVGKAAIPEQFLEYIDSLELASYVEIFAVTKSGSLRQLS